MEVVRLDLLNHNLLEITKLWIYLRKNGLTDLKESSFIEHLTNEFNNKNFNYAYLACILDEGVVGHIRFNWLKPVHPNYKGREKVARIELYVDKYYRKRGCAKMLLQHLKLFMIKNNLELIESIVKRPEGINYGNKQGAREALAQVTFSLKTTGINKDKIIEEIEKSKEDMRKSNKCIPEFRVFLNDIPNSLVENFIRSKTELMNDVPRGEMPGDRFVVTRDMLKYKSEKETREGKIRLIGIYLSRTNQVLAITEIILKENKSHQELTGVIGSMRGQGLAKLIKKEMLVYILLNYPGVKLIETESAPENKVMIKINKDLGFVKTGRYSVQHILVKNILD